MHWHSNPLAGVFGLVGFIIFLWGWANIFRNAGYSGWMALWWIVPIANVIVWIWFSFFATWPIHTDLQLLRARQGSP